MPALRRALRCGRARNPPTHPDGITLSGGLRPWHAGSPTRPSTPLRRSPPRRRLKSWRTWPCSRRRGAASATRWASWTPTRPPPATAGWWARWTCPTAATSCTTSAGTRAARTSAPTPRTRTSSAAIWWCPGRTPRASTSSTPSPIRDVRELVRAISGETVHAATGYAAPHTVHCGPDGIYVNALGAVDGNGPGGIFMLDHDTFEHQGPLGGRARPAEPGL